MRTCGGVDISRTQKTDLFAIAGSRLARKCTEVGHDSVLRWQRVGAIRCKLKAVVELRIPIRKTERSSSFAQPGYDLVMQLIALSSRPLGNSGRNGGLGFGGGGGGSGVGVIAGLVDILSELGQMIFVDISKMLSRVSGVSGASEASATPLNRT